MRRAERRNRWLHANTPIRSAASRWSNNRHTAEASAERSPPHEESGISFLSNSALSMRLACVTADSILWVEARQGWLGFFFSFWPISFDGLLYYIFLGLDLDCNLPGYAKGEDEQGNRGLIAAKESDHSGRYAIVMKRCDLVMLRAHHAYASLMLSSTPNSRMVHDFKT